MPNIGGVNKTPTTNVNESSVKYDFSSIADCNARMLWNTLNSKQKQSLQ